MKKAANSNASADPTPKRKRNKGGAPFGNTNAGKHLAHAKRTAKLNQDRHRRNARKMVREMLRDLGLEDDPTAKLVGLQIERLEEVARRVYAYMEQRGYADRKGNPKPMLKLFVETTDRVLGEARRLLQMLGSRPQERTITQLIIEATKRDPEQRARAPQPDPDLSDPQTRSIMLDAIREQPGDAPVDDRELDEQEQAEVLANLRAAREAAEDAQYVPECVPAVPEEPASTSDRKPEPSRDRTAGRVLRLPNSLKPCDEGEW